MKAYDIVKYIKNIRILTAVETFLNIIYFFFSKIIIQKEKGFSQESKKYYFTVCGIFKDEAEYLKEWILYNKVVGADHIYLYNNNSTDEFQEVLKPFIEDNYVTLITWTKNYAQMEAYEHCYNTYGNETSWMAFFDIDEFICPIKEDNVKLFLKKYEGYPSLMIYWQMFGTNGLMTSDPNKLVTEQFTCGWDHLDGIGKVIISTNKHFIPTHFYNHNMYFYYSILGFRIKIPTITEHKRFVFFPQIYKSPKRNTIQLNHYFSKDYEHFKNKISKGSAASNQNSKIRKKETFFLSHEIQNISERKEIFRFLIQLKRLYYNK